tara:strand:+ start:374 stop:1390 length:1017 start_codon:yes stop_codon:yes gene_type:complete
MKKPAFEGRASSVTSKTILARTLKGGAFNYASFCLELLHKNCEDTELRAITYKGGGLSAREFKFPKYKPNGHGIYINWDPIINAHLEGRGLYFVVNDGGTTDIEITQCRAFFVEWDDIPKEEQLYIYKELNLPEPTFQVETGKSIHNYWVLKKPVSQLIWKPIQKRLVDYTKSDPSIKNPSRVMRLPGFYYVNKQGELTERIRLINVTQKEYSVKDIEDCLPEPEKPKPVEVKPTKPKVVKSDWKIEEIHDALDHIPPRVQGNNTYMEYRDMAWGLTDLLIQMGYSESYAIQLLEAHSPSGEVSGWNVEQVVKSRKGHIKAGTFIFIAQKNGWKPKSK